VAMNPAPETPHSRWRELEPAGEPAGRFALELRDVIKIFRSGPVETVALRGVWLQASPRELIALLGPSGCGKSTVLALCAGLDEPSAGEVRIDGRSLLGRSAAELVAHRASQIALVLQSDNLWSSLSARENVIISCRLAGVPDCAVRADEALAAFGMSDRARHRAAELSGGEQQRVAVAAAFARRPRLVLADEPTGELDSANEALVLRALARLRDETDATVLVVTHSPQVAKTADRVIEMRDGRILE
jgi:ABC-type lipoprotein export system ATPase subunit